MMLKYIEYEKQWYLEGISADGKKWVIQIDKNPFIIGRGSDSNLSLLAKTVSRKHAEIFFKGNLLVIRDLDSMNGTFVNDKRIKDKVELKSDDTIHFGDLKFRIYEKDKKKETASGTMYLKEPEKADGFNEFYDLTKREIEILARLLRGESTKKIADTLFISFGTAKNHISNIFKKTAIHSRYELISLYNNFSSNKKN